MIFGILVIALLIYAATRKEFPMKKIFGLLLVLTLAVQLNAQQYGAVNYASTSQTASAQLIAAPSAGRSIHIYSYLIEVTQSGSAQTFGLSSGTGSVCATGTALVTPAYAGVVSTTQVIQESFGFSFAPAVSTITLFM